MSVVSMDDVKLLRERTGAGMMDCKKALVECGNDLEASIDWLRKKGLAAAAKKSGRIAAEGVVAVCVNGNHGALLEINSETDFVGRNSLFQEVSLNIANIACDGNYDVHSIKSASYLNTKNTVDQELSNLISVIGENITLRRISHVSVKNGAIASYVHNKVSDNLGKIGILVAIQSDGDANLLEELGRKIAMHIAAANPMSVTIDDLDPAIVQRERDVLLEQAKNSGRSDDVVQKMLQGRLRKFYEESVLIEQSFVMNPDIKVKDLIAEAEKSIGSKIEVTSFVKFILGEGIEKEQVDFAAEVAAQIK